MKVYDLKKVEKCYVCGNIDKNIDKFIQNVTSNLPNYVRVEHPKEAERQERLKNRTFGDMQLGGHRRPQMRYEDALRESMRSSMKKMMSCNGNYDSSVILVCGNCGIGKKSLTYYQDMFEKLDKALAPNNCYIFFVRGNNDDPSFFNECKIDFEHVKTIPDYSVVSLKFFNCLCIGGSVSLDKEWKLSQEEVFGKKLYWNGEEPYFDEKELDEVLKKFQIGCIVSSTSPSFAFPGTNAFNRSKWIKDNSTIKGMFSKERKTLDKIYDKILDSDTKPYVWIYGRFKQHNQVKVNDIIFDSLAPFQMEDVRNLISNYFSIDFSKKLGDNLFSLDSLLGEEDKKDCGFMPRFHMPHNQEEPMAEDEGEIEGIDGDIDAEGEEDAFQDEEENEERGGMTIDGGVTLHDIMNDATVPDMNANLTARRLQEATEQLQNVTVNNRIWANTAEIRWEPVQINYGDYRDYTINPIGTTTNG